MPDCSQDLRTRLTSFLLHPITHNAAFLTGSLVLETYGLLFYPVQPVRTSHFITLFFEIYSIALICALLPKRIGRILQILFLFSLYIVVALDAYCIAGWKTGISPTLLSLAVETTPTEIYGFCSNYLLQPSTYRLTLGICCIGAFHLWFRYKWPSFRQRIQTWYTRRLTSCQPRIRHDLTGIFIGMIWLALCYLSWPARSYRWQLYRTSELPTLEQAVGSWGTQNLVLPQHRLAYSIHSLNLSRQQLLPLIENIKATMVDVCTFRSPYIILIIGESANKSHSGLYGYRLPTTPRIQKRVRNGEITVFDNIVSGWNLTSQFFKHSFSLHSMGTSGDWCDATLFPALFRKAGYQVTFLTNQFVPRLDADAWDFSANVFLNHNLVSHMLFDRRNSSSFDYDDELIAYYDTLFHNDCNRNLIIFHLYGQHFDYARRVPDTFHPFQAEDYWYTSLSDNDKQIMASYDNATCFNDSVLHRILQRFESKEAIAIYLSDHGEAMFESNNYYGRQPDAEPTAITARLEYEIPFWIWCSDTYKKHHPEIIRQITNTCHRPFMTDDLPHLLLYLGDINCKEYDAKRNLIAPTFDTLRPRLLRGYANYDSLINSQPTVHYHTSYTCRLP